MIKELINRWWAWRVKKRLRVKARWEWAGGFYFGIMEYNPKEHRTNGTRIKPLGHYITVSSGINPNGISGPEDIGRTFTVKEYIVANAKDYRCRNWYHTEIKLFYEYGRSVDGVVAEYNNLRGGKA